MATEELDITYAEFLYLIFPNFFNHSTLNHNMLCAAKTAHTICRLTPHHGLRKNPFVVVNVLSGCSRAGPERRRQDLLLDMEITNRKPRKGSPVDDRE